MTVFYQRQPSPGRHLGISIFYLFLLFFATACGSESSTPSWPAQLTYEILDTKPHGPDVYTQGLVINGGVITETSGLYAKSFLKQYDAETDQVLKRIALPRDIFAEGITLFDGRFYMLTWHSEKALVFNGETLEQEDVLSYTGEGWGITHDGRHLITSNGTDMLTFRNPGDFSVVKVLKVNDGTRVWNQLNELEYAEGYIWANVWQTTFVLAINPSDGSVKAIANLSELDRINNRYPGDSVLNGIAYDPTKKAYWITGKLWPNRYLVHFSLPALQR